METCNHQSPEDFDSPVDTESLLNKEGVIIRLQDPGVQGALAEFLVCYWAEFYDVYVSVMTQNDGVRPEQVTNEMFSALHHLARGLAIPDSAPIDEIVKARVSHIKRATLDSFKIAVNSALEEEEAMETQLDYVIGSDELSRSPEYERLWGRLRRVKGAKREARVAYEAAKREEARGHFPQAIVRYQEALERGLEMNDIVREFRDNSHVTAALIREGKRLKERDEDKKERSKGNWNLVWATIVGAVLMAVATFLSGYLPSKNPAPPPAIQQPISPPAGTPPAASPQSPPVAPTPSP
ncbi:MAG: hypothetical protein HQL66_07240 [Magnetococcales bacterium]|nr:hypothetical protein [Magnetococcales bacterium]